MPDLLPVDLRHAVRSLLRSPGLTLAAAVTLGVGIGSTAGMYSILRGATRNLPFEDADRIVGIELNDPTRGFLDMRFDREDFTLLESEQTSLGGIAAFRQAALVLSGLTDERAVEYRAAWLTPSSFDVLRAQPVGGRALTREDARPEATAVALLSHRLWVRLYDLHPEAVGAVVRLDGRPTEIVGIMPEAFRFPENQDIWLPLSTTPLEEPERGRGPTFYAFGRLADGMTMARARDELTAVVRRRAAVLPEYSGFTVTVDPYTIARLGRDIVRMILTMVIVVGFVLVIAAVNVANLLLARAVARGREVAVRMALGAGRARIIRELLAESLVIAAVGALLGVGLAWGGTGWFNRAVSSEIQEFWISIRIDGRVLLFVTGVTVVAALIAGVFPALQASAARVGEALKEEKRGTTGFRLGVASQGLVIIEIAFSCGLLVMAGLVVRGAVLRGTPQLDFEPQGVFTASFRLSPPKYPLEGLTPFLDDLEPRLAAIPSVSDVTFTDGLPGVWRGWNRFAIEGEEYESLQEQPIAQVRRVWPSYFETFGITAIDGRTLTDLDESGGERVSVVTDVFAERFFPGSSAIGRRIDVGGDTWSRIVGIVPDQGVMAWSGETIEGVYVSMRQFRTGSVNLALRSAGDPLALTPAVWEVMSGLDSDLPLRDVERLDELVWRQATIERTFGSLFLVVALAALVLATVGLYGVVSFAVHSRTREIGVRRALGAGSAQIVWITLRRSLMQLAIGLGAGLMIAYLLAPNLGEALMGQSPTEPLLYTLVPVLLGAATLGATVVPLTRATRVDPMVALRAE